MKREILAFFLILVMVTGLFGCTVTGENPTASTPSISVSQPADPTEPPLPPVLTCGYFTSLKVNYSDIFISEVSVTYGESSITSVHTSDDYTYTNTYDFYGNLLEQKIDGPDGFSSVETFTYADPKTYGKTSLILSQVYVRGDYRTELTRTYNEQGKKLTEIYTNPEDGSYQESCTYDDQGRLSVNFKTYASGKTTETSFTYDDAGHRIKETVRKNGELSSVTARTYNEAGLLVKEVTDTGKKTTVTLTYDDAGNLILERQTWNKKNWLENRYTYNEAGQLISHVYDEYKGTKTTEEYTYDTQGQLLTVSYVSGSYASNMTHTYDAAGRKIKTVTVSGNYTTQEAWVYDANGNLTEYAVTEADGSQTFERRTYDAHGHLLTFTAINADGDITTSCAYTYGYVELTDEAEAQRLRDLMHTVFVEFLP